MNERGASRAPNHSMELYDSFSDDSYSTYSIYFFKKIFLNGIL